MKFYLPTLLFAAAALTAACSGGATGDDKDDVTLLADSFGYNYFNFRFEKALAYCTPESEKWLRFRATNVLQEDVDILRSQEHGAGCEVKDVSFTTDTSATVTCKASNFLRTDTLGRPGCMTDKGTYVFNAVKRGDKWLIKMEGLPQSEKQSRD